MKNAVWESVKGKYVKNQREPSLYYYLEQTVTDNSLERKTIQQIFEFKCIFLLFIERAIINGPSERNKSRQNEWINNI